MHKKPFEAPWIHASTALLLGLVVISPATVSAQRVYEGTTVETDDDEVDFTGPVQIAVKGTAPELTIVYRTGFLRDGVVVFQSGGQEFKVTLIGSSYSGALDGFGDATITGEICLETISGFVSGFCCPIITYTFTAACVSDCDVPLGLPPECEPDEDEDEDEEEEEDDPCPAPPNTIEWLNNDGGPFDLRTNWFGEEVPGTQAAILFGVPPRNAFIPVHFDDGVNMNYAHDRLTVRGTPVSAVPVRKRSSVIAATPLPRRWRRSGAFCSRSSSPWGWWARRYGRPRRIYG